ncbi:MAG: hypothetical protein QXL77_00570 [Candidatus Bathyarchaeia archaeon]
MIKAVQNNAGKRLLRIFLLLLSSVLVVAASASVLNYLYMQASPITTETAKVHLL